MIAQNKKLGFLYLLGAVVVSFIIFNVIMMGMPVLAYGFVGFPFMMFIISGIIGVIMYVRYEILSEELSYNDNVSLKHTYYKPVKYSIYSIIFWGVSFTIIPFITSAPIFGNADNYRQLIGKVTEKSFSDSTLNVSLKHIRVVDEENAKLLGDKKLGEDLGLGSRVTIGKYNIQKVRDQLYWVAPLEYKSFTKWLNNDGGTEGYVMVSAQNSKDVKLVKKVEGKPLKLKYLKNAYWSQFIDRHIYLNGYSTIGLTDYTFEVDDNLKPYYVVTTYDKTIGFLGSNATGILTVDVQTGEIKQYNLNNIPKWVDRVQPESFINEQLNDWGEYVHGWWNSTGFSEQKEVTQLTDGQKLVYVNDGNSYWYSGLTSVGKDNSIIGFLLTNTRTKNTLFYKQSGATEKAAMRSAEGKVQEKRYHATFPSLYKIAGIPTYVLTLKDDEGLVKLFAMVSVEQYEIVGVGTTLKAALRDYKSLLYSKGNNLTKTETKHNTTTNLVTRRSVDIRNGVSYYYIKLKNDSRMYVGNSNISDELPLTIIGDKVTIEYQKSSEQSKITDILSFDNSQL